VAAEELLVALVVGGRLLGRELQQFAPAVLDERPRALDVRDFASLGLGVALLQRFEVGVDDRVEQRLEQRAAGRGVLLAVFGEEVGVGVDQPRTDPRSDERDIAFEGDLCGVVPPDLVEAHGRATRARQE
jgi:hypothetical protein